MVARASRVRGAAAILLAFFLVVPAAARAHASPDHCDPKVGSTLSASPGRVRIWFDSDLETAFSSIAIQREGGATVDKGDGRVDSSDRKLLEVSIPQLAPGTYRVAWSVVARDGHRASGDYKFTIR
jgi:methionine-rich copper-binding protein CopC